MRRIMMTIGCGLVLCGSSLVSAQEKQAPAQAPAAKPVQAPAQKPTQAPAQKVAPVQAPTQKLQPVQKGGDVAQKGAVQKPTQKPCQSPVQKGGY